MLVSVVSQAVFAMGYLSGEDCDEESFRFRRVFLDAA